jgi:hypothetical protein
MYTAVTAIVAEVIAMGVMLRTHPFAVIESMASISVAGVLTVLQMYRSRADLMTAMGIGAIFVITAASTLLVLSAFP